MMSQRIGDLISREETLTAFADYVGSGMSMDDYDALWDIVAKMPSVDQQENIDLIDQAFLRANSIDAVRGRAYREGHIREAEELENARAMILQLVDHIKVLEQGSCVNIPYKDYSWLKDHCYKTLKKPCSPNARNEHLAILDLIREHEERQWIPVSERLPEENKTVIASTEYGVFPETRYTKEYGWEWAYESGADYWRELEDVTAWMPLPKRYESPESEGSESKRYAELAKSYAQGLRAGLAESEDEE